MKKAMILLLLLFPVLLKAQLSGDLFGTRYNFSKPTLSGSGGGGGGGGNWNSNVSSSTYSTPSSSVIITQAYDKKAAEAYNEGVEAWKKKDWDEAIRQFNKAQAFNPKNSDYIKYRDQAKGLKEWYRGIDEATKKNWDKAIARYREALRFFPEDKTLKDNIIACSYNKTSALAEKYYDNSDHINAAVYYNILLKNFDDKRQVVIDRYTESYQAVSNMKKSEQALSKFNLKLKEVRDELPFINSEWGE